MGKFIKYNNAADKICKVTGVLENTPANTNFPLQIVLSFKTAEGEDGAVGWGGQDGSLNTFLVLPENITTGQFENNLKALVKNTRLLNMLITDNNAAVR